MTATDTSSNIGLTITGQPRWTQPDDPADSAGEAATLLTITHTGDVAVYSGKVEYGQAIRHGFALTVSDELLIAPSEVEVVLADTARVPWDRGTVGSASTRTTGVQLRRAAIAARRVLTGLAAERFGVDEDRVALSGGVFSNESSNATATFADLLQARDIRGEIPEDIPAIVDSHLSDNGDRGLRIDAVEKVTGKAVYARDVDVPGMAYGKIVRPPSYGAEVTALDAGRAERTAGFISLVHEGNFVGVVAETESAAEFAAGAVRVRWNEHDSGDVSDWNLPAALKEQADEQVVLQESGSTATGLAESETVVEGTYYAPYVANAQMEPSAAVAAWEDDNLTIWSSSRGPFAERAQLATALGIAEANIRVIAQAVGGSFGTKTPTVSIEAARLARAANRPVKVTYSREEEFTWSTVRPAALIEIRAGATGDGKLTAWEYSAYNSGDVAIRGRRGAQTPYDAEHIRVAVSASISPLQYGSYRSLGGAVNHFAREAHVDRMARKLGIDPLELRLRNLSHPRYRRVLETAANSFGWEDRERRDGFGYGIAVGFDAGSYVAECAEVEVKEGEVRVVRVTAAFDCGEIVNADGVRNQVEGSIIMGMGTALWEMMEFDGSRVLTTGFDRYRVPRIMDTPLIDVVIIDDASNPSTGAGEPGIVPVAAAIANAVTDASGTQVEQIPLENATR